MRPQAIIKVKIMEFSINDIKKNRCICFVVYFNLINFETILKSGICLLIADLFLYKDGVPTIINMQQREK